MSNSQEKTTRASIALGIVPVGAKLVIQSALSNHCNYYVYVKGIWYPWQDFEVLKDSPVDSEEELSRRWLKPYHRRGLVSTSY